MPSREAVTSWIFSEMDSRRLLNASGFISGGRPVLLVRDGRPVAVIIDVDSYQESEDAIGGAPEYA